MSVFKATHLSCIGGLFLAVGCAQAEWVLDPESSSLSFVSIKAENVAEVHQFKALNGTLGQAGNVRINVALDSVDTGIEIRDERMRDLLFDTPNNPLALVEVQVPEAMAMSVGDSAVLVVPVSVTVANKTITAMATARVSRLADGRYEAISTHPVLLNASVMGLERGIEALREVAGLSSISHAVPVTFRVTFISAEGAPVKPAAQ